MELEDLIMLAAASLLATRTNQKTKHARKDAVKEARLLWKQVLEKEEE